MRIKCLAQEHNTMSPARSRMYEEPCLSCQRLEFAYVHLITDAHQYKSFKIGTMGDWLLNEIKRLLGQYAISVSVLGLPSALTFILQ